jgi:hypothetical protein
VLGRMCHVPNEHFNNILDNDFDEDPGDQVYFSRVIEQPECVLAGPDGVQDAIGDSWNPTEFADGDVQANDRLQALDALLAASALRSRF